jgi:hypothetical protein
VNLVVEVGPVVRDDEKRGKGVMRRGPGAVAP